MHRNPSIALLTYSGRPELTADDAVVAAHLTRTHKVEPVPWDVPDSAKRLAAFDVAVIRSTWNYTDHYQEFLAWLNEVEEQSVQVLNPIPLMRWNTDKIYLNQLSQRGHQVLDTVWIDRASTANLHGELRRLEADRAVVKPRVSATASGLFSTSRESAVDDQDKLDRLLSTHDVMLQPFAPEIVDDGEWSLVFFGNDFSHSVLKRPRTGDIRVQNDFGGTSELRTAPEALVADAADLLRDVEEFRGEAILYARVDGIDRNGRLVLMELEVVEPDLFFSLDGNSPRRFEQALARLCAGG